MASIEFDLARLTAKSHGFEPKLPGGSLPYLTVEDIALGAAMVDNKHAYQLLMAKYCQDERAMSRALKYVFWTSWALWAEKRREGDINFKTMLVFAEVTLLDFLVPSRLTKADRDTRAKFMRIQPQTWRRKFRRHHAEMVAHLYALESDAIRQIKKRLR